jgi:hypothetical protein
MFKAFADLSKANVEFHNQHPVASTALAVTSTIAALVIINTASRLIGRTQIVNIYYQEKS